MLQCYIYIILLIIQMLFGVTFHVTFYVTTKKKVTSIFYRMLHFEKVTP